MAANYWTSTQRQNWLFTSQEIDALRDALRKSHLKLYEQHPLPDRRLIFIYIRELLTKLSKRGLQFRQQCMATALVYLHRYFLYNPIQNVNLYLLVATAFYLSSKTEEAPHHIRLVASEARQQWADYIPNDPARLGEMEFCLISEMHSQLIVWHPYRSLTALKESQTLALTNEELSLAWSIINDTFMTDLPLTCPPHLIAITAMFLAVVFIPTKPPFDFMRPLTGIEIGGYIETGQFAVLNRRWPVPKSYEAKAANDPTIPKQPPRDPVADAAAVKARILADAAESPKMQNVMKFLVESEIDVERMIDATQEMISLYEVWEASYNEKTIKDAIHRCIRGQHPD